MKNLHGLIPNNIVYLEYSPTCFSVKLQETPEDLTENPKALIQKNTMTKREEEMAYYRINEIFKHKKELYRCVEEKEMEDGCSKCALFSLGCIGAECSSDSRWDEKSVYFIQVYEPECGMLFRASDGVLYKFCHKKDLHGDIECACHENGLKCKDIFKQAFENFEFEKFDIALKKVKTALKKE